jgi:hypothetical protein
MGTGMPGASGGVFNGRPYLAIGHGTSAIPATFFEQLKHFPRRAMGMKLPGYSKQPVVNTRTGAGTIVQQINQEWREVAGHGYLIAGGIVLDWKNLSTCTTLK